MSATKPVPRPFARSLRLWGGGAVSAALAKAGLAADDDVEEAHHLFWRFATDEEMPVGFGGLGLRSRRGQDALLRSVVTLPPLRDRGSAPRLRPRSRQRRRSARLLDHLDCEPRGGCVLRAPRLRQVCGSGRAEPNPCQRGIPRSRRRRGPGETAIAPQHAPAQADGARRIVPGRVPKVVAAGGSAP